MNWFQKLFCRNRETGCDHQWKNTYSYLSVKCIFASLSDEIDRSGSLTVGQECKSCGKGRSKLTTYAKNGSIESITFR